jgi:membrane protease YdiL (CAAX protease family)
MSTAAARGAPVLLSKRAVGYFQRSERPFVSLVFLLPLIAFYELGTRWFNADPVTHTEQRIIAFTLLQGFFSWFGAHGRSLPAFAVIAILLSWHLIRRDSWKVQPTDLLGMALESAVLAIPLLVIGSTVANHLLMPSAQPSPTASLVVLSIGAGVYEELVFRLIGMSALSFLLLDVLEVRRALGVALTVLISSMAFSGYHYLGSEMFNWAIFAFRTGAGVFFAVVFLYRGFGITAGCHTTYDLLVVGLQASH